MSNRYNWPYQVLPLRARVILKAMATKGYSTFLKASVLQEPHHQSFSVIFRTRVGEVLPFSRDSVGVFHCREWAEKRPSHEIRDIHIYIIWKLIVCRLHFETNQISILCTQSNGLKYCNLVQVILFKTATTQECCKQYWTNPEGNIPQSSCCTATYHPSRKLFKLDEPDMWDTAGEVGTNS